TNASRKDTILKLIAQGAQDYLVKEELDDNALNKAIWLALNRKKQASASNSSNQKNKELSDIIKKQKQQLDDILSSISDVVWSRRGDDFSLLYINKACFDVYGYTPEEMMSEEGKTLDHIHPDDRELLNEKISRTIKNGSGGMEYRIIHKDGSIKYLYGHSTVTYKDGKPEVVNGVSVDITDIRNAEKALAEKQLDMEDLFESITERFFSADKNWNITYVNKQFEKFYNISGKDIIGKRVTEAFPNIVNTHFHVALQRSMEESIVTHSEGISPTSGKYISLDAYPTRNGIGVYIKDITEQKELHDQLLNEEQKLRAIINNTKDIIWYVDKDQNIISGNQAFYDRIAEMTNKEYRELTNDDFKEEEVKKWNAFFTRALSGEHFKVIEENIVRGKKVYEEISFNPIPDKDNTIVGISCFSRDITEEKTLQDQILLERQNLKALLNNTKDFIWSVDKDLNVISVNEPFVDFISNFTNKVLKPGDPILFYDFGETIRDTWLKAYTKALAGKRVIFEDENIIDGKSFYTEKSLNPIFDDKGEVVGVSCFAHDKSEEIKLRKQIQKDEQSLRATINNTKDHIWSVDTDLKIIFLNQSAKDFVFDVTGQTLGAGDFVLPEGFSEAFIETRTAHYRKALEGTAFSIVDE
ncbi:MAG: PAS domain S-box protein, partial [Bacteroidetes bacterium]|nr:PAS domain S-box protein [Bacteroidota bacterium]